VREDAVTENLEGKTMGRMLWHMDMGVFGYKINANWSMPDY
jgi:hypothetical protein